MDPEVSNLILLLSDIRLTVVVCGYSTLKHFFSDTYAHGIDERIQKTSDIGHQPHALVAFITQDSMNFVVLAAVLAACAVCSLVRFKIALMASFGSKKCCYCSHKKYCLDSTSCRHYCGYGKTLVCIAKPIDFKSHTLLTVLHNDSNNLSCNCDGG